MNWFEKYSFVGQTCCRLKLSYETTLITTGAMLDICKYVNEHKSLHFEFEPNNQRLKELYFPIPVKFHYARCLFKRANLKYINFENIDISSCDNIGLMLKRCSLEHNAVVKLDTKNVTSMRKVFESGGCEGKNMSVIFDTRKVTTTLRMFKCFECEKLDISSFDMKNVNHTDLMFYGSSIKYLLANFNMQEVVQLNGMFADSMRLLKVNLSLCDLQNTYSMDNLFSHCRNILFVILYSSNYHEIMSSALFHGCICLKFVVLDGFELKNTPDIPRMRSSDRKFDGCTSLIHVAYNIRDEDLKSCESLIV